MRGSTPLDVAASSVMDNNGLALALEEPDLDKVRLFVLFTFFSFFYPFDSDTHAKLLLKRKIPQLEPPRMNRLKLHTVYVGLYGMFCMRSACRW